MFYFSSRITIGEEIEEIEYEIFKAYLAYLYTNEISFNLYSDLAEIFGKNYIIILMVALYMNDI